MRIESHRNLLVWQKAIKLSLGAYNYTRSFPRDEQYGLTSQIRRACVSIAANIAEGNGRRTDRDYAHFLSMAIGSAREVDTLFVMARELRLGDAAELEYCEGLLGEVDRMLGTIHHRYSG